MRRIIVSTGEVSTLAGSVVRTSGSVDGVGTSAMFNEPVGVSMNLDGNLALVVSARTRRLLPLLHEHPYLLMIPTG